MLLRLMLCVVLGCSLAACSSPAKKLAEKNKAQHPDMADMSGDIAFQAFVGRLRKAVAAHDMETLAPLMTTDFLYRLNPDASGEGVFPYWDQEAVWPQLQAVLGQRFVPFGNCMVAPPEFAADPANFHGYRAGIASVDGVWKFVYFTK